MRAATVPSTRPWAEAASLAATGDICDDSGVSKNKTVLQKQLGDIAAQLKLPQLQALVEFAEYLRDRHGADEPQAIADPQPIERPDNESVIAALKRLSATYPMLDKGKMLHETSSLVAEHVMQGREASDVIDELEEIFYNHFHKLKSQNGPE